MNFLPSDASREGVTKGASKYGTAPEGRVDGKFPERRNAGTVACVGCNKPGVVDDMKKTENGYMCGNCMPNMADGTLAEPEKREENHAGTDEPGQVLGLDKTEGVQTTAAPENDNPTDKLADDPDAGEISNTKLKALCEGCAAKHADAKATGKMAGAGIDSCDECKGGGSLAMYELKNDEAGDVAEIDRHVEGIKHEAKEIAEARNGVEIGAKRYGTPKA